jgi:F-type H+-transporting ATPase subunit delta
MTSRVAAARYARALLEVVLKEADAEAAERELGGFVGLLKGHPELEKPLINPAVPAARKLGVVTALAERSRLSPVVTRLLQRLAERDQLQLLPDVLAAFRTRLMDHLGVVAAEVTTAVPLPEDRTAALRDALAAATGKRVVVTVHTDPAIIGGVVARVGGTIYDGSVTRQLERMKEKLAEGA